MSAIIKIYDAQGNQYDLNSKEIGDLDRLNTNNKQNIVSALNEIKNIPKIDGIPDGTFIKVINGQVAPEQKPEVFISKYIVEVGYSYDGYFAYDSQIWWNFVNTFELKVHSMEVIFYKNLGSGNYIEKKRRLLPMKQVGINESFYYAFLQEETYTDIGICVKYYDINGQLATINSNYICALPKDSTVI